MNNYVFIFLAVIYLASCVKDEPGEADNSGIVQSDNQGGGSNPDNEEGDWLVPDDQVYDGGPGKDGIPALTDPEFTSAEEALYLRDTDLVIGYVHNGEARAYPHNILAWHEIINDGWDNLQLAVIYCPLTGTGVGWDRVIDGSATTFGVSGLLYNANIIPYDRKTDSNWSQMLLKAVNGRLKGESAKTYNVVETRWDTWKSMYPGTLILSEETGYNRNYFRYPYGDYRTSNSLIFPVNHEDSRLHKKERVLGIIVDDAAKAFRIEDFGSQISLIHDGFNGNDLIIAGSREKNFIVAFHREGEEGTIRHFTPVQNRLPLIMKDNEGTYFDILGKGVEGPGKGGHLVPVTGFIGYWFAWAAFYPGIILNTEKWDQM